MPSVMRSLRLPDELNTRVNEAAGEDFSGWARAAFEARLGCTPADSRDGEHQPSVRPAADRTEAFRKASALLSDRNRAR